MYRKLFFILFGFTGFFQAFSQFAPIGSIPTIYNSGFAGEAGVPRIAAFSFVNTNYNTTPKFTTLSNCISYDNFVKKIRSGISITVGQHTRYTKDEFQAVTPRFEKCVATIGISPKFSFRGKYTIAPFVDFSLTSVGKLVNYFSYDSPVRQSDYQYKSVLARTGFLMNSSRAYVGLTVTVSESKFDEKKPASDPPLAATEATIDVMLQTGYTFQRPSNPDYSFTPQVAIRWDKNSPMIHRRIMLYDISLMWRFKKFIWGLNTTGVVLGYQNDRLKFMVSQWLTFTGHNYAASIGVRYKFKSNDTSTIPFK